MELLYGKTIPFCWMKSLMIMKKKTIIICFQLQKSVMSLLIGIAIEKNYIKSVEDTILDLLPHYENHMSKRDKTIKTQTLTKYANRDQVG